MQRTLKITEQYRVGRSKYVVSYCTGKQHADGSDFYDIEIFANKRAKDAFIAKLRSSEETNGTTTQEKTT